MATEDYILKFEIVPGRSPDLEAIARALLAYVDVLKVAAEVIDPHSVLQVELVGVEDGSDLFKLALNRMQAAGERLKAGADAYPYPAKAAMALGWLVAATAIAVPIQNALTPDFRLPDDQMAVFNEINQNLAASVRLQHQTADFFGIVQDEPAIDAVQVLDGNDERTVLYDVPRAEFAARSGLWSGDKADVKPAEEPRIATWDVTLIKPVLVGEARRWTFAKDGIEFTALMADPHMLRAIRNRTLGIQIAEGESMTVEVHYKERKDGNAWRPVPGSRRVKKVIRPVPPPPSVPLFPAPRDP